MRFPNALKKYETGDITFTLHTTSYTMKDAESVSEMLQSIVEPDAIKRKWAFVAGSLAIDSRRRHNESIERSRAFWLGLFISLSLGGAFVVCCAL